MANAKGIKNPPTQRGDVITATAAYTLKNSDSGKICKWNAAAGFNFNLPPVQKAFKGVFYDFIIATAATSVGHGVSPNANDTIFNPAGAATDNKDVVFAHGSDKVGLGFRLVSDGVDGWHMIHLYDDDTAALTQES